MRPRSLAAVLASCTLILFASLPPELGAQTTSERRNVTLRYTPGGASQNGYADAQLDVVYWFQDCVDGVALVAEYQPRPRILIMPHRYWVDGREVEVPAHFQVPNAVAPSIRGTVRGRGLSREVNHIHAATANATCANNGVTVAPHSQLWQPDATRDERAAILRELGLDAQGSLPPLINAAVENHFRTLWAQARRDSTQLVQQARNDSIARARAQQAAAGGHGATGGAAITGAAAPAGATATAAEQQQTAEAEGLAQEIARRQAQIDAQREEFRQRGEQATRELVEMGANWLADRERRSAELADRERREAAARRDAAEAALAHRAREFAQQRAAASGDPRSRGTCVPSASLTAPSLRPLPDARDPYHSLQWRDSVTALDCRAPADDRSFKAYRVVVDSARWLAVSAAFERSVAARVDIYGAAGRIATTTGGTIRHRFEPGSYVLVVARAPAAGDIGGPITATIGSVAAGPGFMWEQKGGHYVVTAVAKGSAAERAQVRGKRVLAIDGQELTGQDPRTPGRLAAGDPGTTYTALVARNNRDRPETVLVECSRRPLPHPARCPWCDSLREWGVYHPSVASTPATSPPGHAMWPWK
jgi:hypothetical protein